MTKDQKTAIFCAFSSVALAVFLALLVIMIKWKLTIFK